METTPISVRVSDEQMEVSQNVLAPSTFLPASVKTSTKHRAEFANASALKLGFFSTKEVDGLSYVWRWFLKALLLRTRDHVNALRVTRLMQLSLPFLTGHEAHILNCVISAFESGAPHPAHQWPSCSSMHTPEKAPWHVATPDFSVCHSCR